MHPALDAERPDIARELERLLAVRAGSFARAGRRSADAARRLGGFATRGKMVRGGLLVLGWRMHGGEAGPVPRQVVLRAAAALELLHSALLVHDDIMDGDRLRRGEPTVHARYEDEARRARAGDPVRAGTALGISAGDLAIFTALDEIAALDVDPGLGIALARQVGRELALVGAGQFEDVSLGVERRWPSRAEVLAVYTYKTARYTFSLPLSCGALLAGARPAQVARLERFGELLGTVFQVLDDDLGMFGSEGDTGKPVGADIREGKKTLLALEILRRAGRAERRRIEPLFGKRNLGRRDLDAVREAAERTGARQAVLDAAARMAKQAERVATGLRVDPEHRRVLRELCSASVSRRT
jgi:geranylgeranyl diphosphate synthase, type I